MLDACSAGAASSAYQFRLSGFIVSWLVDLAITLKGDLPIIGLLGIRASTAIPFNSLFQGLSFLLFCSVLFFTFVDHSFVVSFCCGIGLLN